MARRLYFLPSDIIDSITGKRPAGVPPRGLIFTGPGDFVKTGEKYLKYFIEFGGLQPHHSVLDIGCGIGRMALPLAKYLNKDGSYEGFDIVKKGVEWCEEHISPMHPNFNFRLTGLYNQLYNTSDLPDASNFKFPYPNEQFDFAFLTSVFTHMMPLEVENYIREISRVLKPGGTCFFTAFIVNCESEDLMITNPSVVNFPINKGFYRMQSKKVNTANVSYDEEWLLGQLDNSGLKMEHIKYGQWCGRKLYVDFQDIVVCRKIQLG